MVDFRAIIENLVDIGFYTTILPFLLVYVVIFGILEKTKIFSSDNTNQVKNINSIIAFVFALFAVASINTVIYIQNFVTIMITFVIFILVVLIILGFIFGDDYIKLLKDDNGLKKNISYTIAGIVLVIAIVVFVFVVDGWNYVADLLDDNLGSDSFWTVVIIIVIGIILYLVTKESNGGNKNQE